MNLKVAAVQSNLVWESKEDNLKIFGEKLKTLKDADLVILPEMFTSGFSMNADVLFETMEGETVNWMKLNAVTNNYALAGSLIIKEGEQYYNRMVFVYPDGRLEYYDKRHLFRMANEHDVFTAGKAQKIVEYLDWKICLNVCYDLRFPVWSRNIDNYDLLIYTANWPEKRVTHWSRLLKARAIENLCFVVGVNRVGKDGNDHYYSGHSAILEPSGNKLRECVDKEEILLSTLSKNDLISYRKKFGFLLDRDKFKIEI